MVQYRCRNNDCRHWYEKQLGECPQCGTAPHAPNKWLRTATLNNHLYQSAKTQTGKDQYRAAYKTAHDTVTQALA